MYTYNTYSNYMGLCSHYIPLHYQHLGTRTTPLQKIYPSSRDVQVTLHRVQSRLHSLWGHDPNRNLELLSFNGIFDSMESQCKVGPRSVAKSNKFRNRADLNHDCFPILQAASSATCAKKHHPAMRYG